jgi:hypothetical protein
LDLIEESVHRHRLRIHCYTLMDNHYHLIVETPLAAEDGGKGDWKWRGKSPRVLRSVFLGKID